MIWVLWVWAVSIWAVWVWVVWVWMLWYELYEYEWYEGHENECYDLSGMIMSSMSMNAIIWVVWLWAVWVWMLWFEWYDYEQYEHECYDLSGMIMSNMSMNAVMWVRVEWFIIFLDFTTWGCFMNKVQLVLRPFVKKKFAHAPPSERAAKFSFSKNRRDLKNEYLFLKICRILPNTSKNNCQK